jgi:hypothetical protein
MPYKTRKLFYRRVFLNRPRYNSGAHVIAYLDLETGESHRTKKPYTHLFGDLEISDCHRVITLSLSGNNKREANNSLRKIRLLGQICADLADAYEQAVHDAYGDPP